MGVDILWFMPITPISREGRLGILGSYYACSDYTAINPEYGTLDDFKILIKHAHEQGFKVIIAGAGGAAHLPGMVASATPLPVIGVPVPLKYLDGMDSLLSIVQMPAGVPVGTLAIGRSGAINAALLAASILALSDEALSRRLQDWRARQTESVAEKPVDPENPDLIV